MTQEWISAVYAANVSNIWPMDVRTVISAHAQILRSFCTNAQRAISYAAVSILASPLVSVKALPSSLVRFQVEVQKKTLISTSQSQLAVGINSLQLITSSTHLISGLGTNSFFYIPSNESSTASVAINAYKQDSHSAPCYCITIDKCAMPSAIYLSREAPTFGFYDLQQFANQTIPIKGIQVGCFPMDGLLVSTLECYHDRSCLELLVSNATVFPPLLSTLKTQFPSNTTVQRLVDEVMVEDWSINTSFAAYYNECAPKTCTYSYNQRNGLLIIFTTILALIGGLNTVLRVLVPFIVQLMTKIIQRSRSKKDANQHPTIVWTEERSRLGKRLINILHSCLILSTTLRQRQRRTRLIMAQNKNAKFFRF